MLRLVRGMVCRDTVAVAEWLVEHSTCGELRGVAVCVRRAHQDDEVLLTGVYRNRPTMALAAAARMTWVASRMMDRQEERA
jgi:hypothetical protein